MRNGKFEIRLCPALLNKPTLPTPHFAGDADAAARNDPVHQVDKQAEKRDPFLAPYNSGYLGELYDEEDGESFALLVSGSIFLCRVPSDILRLSTITAE